MRYVGAAVGLALGFWAMLLLCWGARRIKPFIRRRAVLSRERQALRKYMNGGAR